MYSYRISMFFHKNPGKSVFDEKRSGFDGKRSGFEEQVQVKKCCKRSENKLPEIIFVQNDRPDLEITSQRQKIKRYQKQTEKTLNICYNLKSRKNNKLLKKIRLEILKTVKDQDKHQYLKTRGI